MALSVSKHVTSARPRQAHDDVHRRAFITSGTPVIDNVRLSLAEDVRAVPEPASLVLVVAPLFGAGAVRRLFRR
jgi:hypothetical protein